MDKSRAAGMILMAVSAAMFWGAMMHLRRYPDVGISGLWLLLAPSLLCLGLVLGLMRRQDRYSLLGAVGTGAATGLYMIAGARGYLTMPERLQVLLMGRAGEDLWLQLNFVIWG